MQHVWLICIIRCKIKTIIFFTMANVTIDGKDYDLDTLSDEAKQQLSSLQYVQGEIKRLNASIAVCKTAAASYSLALKQEIEK